MFADCERVIYGRHQLLDVVCQLRFPTILSIETKSPADFQEQIRGTFPRYSEQQEMVPPKNGGQPVAVTNYQFVSADGKWKVNLTKNFIALATPAYTRWEDFAAKLDQILVAFIETYKPAYFERVGLRYVNAFSRQALNLTHLPFNQLIQPAYLGLLGEDDVNEQNFNCCTQDVEMALPGNCHLKLHAGPGMVKRNNVENPEIHYIIDSDVFVVGNIAMAQSARALSAVHAHAKRIFHGAITQQLHEAMEPQDVN